MATQYNDVTDLVVLQLSEEFNREQLKYVDTLRREGIVREEAVKYALFKLDADKQALKENKLSIDLVRAHNKAVTDALTTKILENKDLRALLDILRREYKTRLELLELAEDRNENDAEIIKANERLRELQEQDIRLKEATFELEQQRQRSIKVQNATLSRQERTDALLLTMKEKEARKRELRLSLKYGNITQEDYNREIEDLEHTFAVSIGGLLPAISDKFPFLTKGLSVLSDISGMVSTGLKLANKLVDGMDKAVDTAMNIRTENLGRIESRIYGTNKTFDGIAESINAAVASSPWVSLPKLIENIQALTLNGIVYNVELRALLATLKDDLVSTFEVTNANLTRLVRLLLQDITMATMGTESELTKFLNGRFNDNSYLSDMYDSVYQATVDALANMDYSRATEFNSIVQTWLGALYSVGLSQGAVSNISSAIGYLGAGDLTKLTGNTLMLTLLATATNRAGYSYADILTLGITSQQTNDILASMVEYLASIANNTSSNVLKSEFGNLLGLEVADWRALANFSPQDIVTTRGQAESLTYQSVLNEATSLFSNETLSLRISIGERINNFLSNSMYEFGSDIANSEDKYLLWQGAKILREVNDLTGVSETLVGKLLNGASTVALLLTGAGGMVDVVKGALLTFATNGDISGAFMEGLPLSMREAIGYELPKTGIVYKGLSASESLSTGNIYTDAALGTAGLLAPSSDVKIEPLYNNTAYQYTSYTTSQSDASSTYSGQLANAKTATVDTINNNEYAIARNVSDLYDELFNKLTPIRVKLSSVEEDARGALNIQSIDSSIKDILDLMRFGGMWL